MFSTAAFETVVTLYTTARSARFKAGLERADGDSAMDLAQGAVAAAEEALKARDHLGPDGTYYEALKLGEALAKLAAAQERQEAAKVSEAKALEKEQAALAHLVQASRLSVA